MRLQTEQKYRSVRYASTRHSDAARWPKRTITYTQMQEAYYLKDHLGNIRVTLDGNGNVVTTDDYYAFGLQMPGRSYNMALTGSIYKYAGKELDEESGLNWYYFGARYYDPKIGRFLSVDPLAKFQSNMTPYHYTHNNPLSRIDPTGMQDKDIPETEPIYVTATRLPTLEGNTYVYAPYLGPLIDWSRVGEVVWQGTKVLTSTGVAVIGFVLIPTRLEAPTLKKESDPVDDILKDAEPGEKTKGKSENWIKDGGQSQADKDFNHLNPTNVRLRPNGAKTGELPDGRQVNVRPHSTDGRPTLEIQNLNNTRIKIRYN